MVLALALALALALVPVLEPELELRRAVCPLGEAVQQRPCHAAQFPL